MVKLELIEFADFIKPKEIVAEIFRQNPCMSLPIPLEQIAKAAGIVEIRQQPLESLEGALVANTEKTEGAILVNSNSLPIQRQRFTIGHELGHFMLPKHNYHMECLSKDLHMSSYNSNYGLTASQRIEMEANEFAAELLMPQQYFTTHPNCPQIPNCTDITSLAERFGVSFKASIYRYQDLCRFPLGVVFSQNSEITSVRRNKPLSFWIKVTKGKMLPDHLHKKIQTMTSGTVHKDKSPTSVWFDIHKTTKLPNTIIEETLLQENGYATTLLWFE